MLLPYLSIPMKPLILLKRSIIKELSSWNKLNLYALSIASSSGCTAITMTTFFTPTLVELIIAYVLCLIGIGIHNLARRSESGDSFPTLIQKKGSIDLDQSSSRMDLKRGETAMKSKPSISTTSWEDMPIDSLYEDTPTDQSLQHNA